jgi:LysM repeat protein
LSQIAADQGVSMEAIIRANGIQDPSAIYVGQKFEIPGCRANDPYAEPVDRGSYANERSAQEWEITHGERPEENVQRTGPAIRPAEQEGNWDEQKAQPERREITYVVQPGDMLSWIAQEYNVNAYDLATYNGIDNLNVIYTGQVLVIPN